MTNNSITDVVGIKVGHADNKAALTGCTVVLCENGAVAGVSQRGGAPGTRETDLLRPSHSVQKIHAVLLSGGSAYGLDAAGGVMQYLEEQKIGFQVGPTVVPIVPSAILYDLDLGDHTIRPDKEMGYQACMNATTNKPIAGNIGAGTGATVGKILGNRQAMKSGIGSASIEIGNGIVIGAIIAVNAFGDIIEDGKIIAGTRTIKKGPITIGSNVFFADTREVMQSFAGRQILSFASRQNTVIGVIATNAELSKEEINYIADIASNGISHVVRPAFTMFDGDTIFSIATGKVKADVNLIAAYAPDVVAAAILCGVKAAEPIAGLPSYNAKRS
jgi:L-aminopeptidase/D-esterase-like protein